jgi:hypothetical protein
MGKRIDGSLLLHTLEDKTSDLGSETGIKGTGWDV